jgi:F-type H+-transporting ATPase subunit a
MLWNLINITNLLLENISIISIILLYLVIININKIGNITFNQESLYATIHSIVINQINAGKGKIYFPFIYTLFIFILINNLIGMVPYSFASTSHFIFTFGLNLNLPVFNDLYLSLNVGLYFSLIAFLILLLIILTTNFNKFKNNDWSISQESLYTIILSVLTNKIEFFFTANKKSYFIKYILGILYKYVEIKIFNKKYTNKYIQSFFYKLKNILFSYNIFNSILPLNWVVTTVLEFLTLFLFNINYAILTYIFIYFISFFMRRYLVNSSFARNYPRLSKLLSLFVCIGEVYSILGLVKYLYGICFMMGFNGSSANTGMGSSNGGSGGPNKPGGGPNKPVRLNKPNSYRRRKRNTRQDRLENVQRNLERIWEDNEDANLNLRNLQGNQQGNQAVFIHNQRDIHGNYIRPVMETNIQPIIPHIQPSIQPAQIQDRRIIPVINVQRAAIVQENPRIAAVEGQNPQSLVIQENPRIPIVQGQNPQSLVAQENPRTLTIEPRRSNRNRPVNSANMNIWSSNTNKIIKR